MDANEIVAAITDRIKDTANVSVVFGDTIETAAGISIIPVASVKLSGGGGRGHGKWRTDDTEADSSKGLGLGLMVAAHPLGYIEIKGEGARFVPTPDVTKIAVGGLVASGLLLMTINRAMRFKAWQKRKMWRHQHAGF